MNNHVEGGMRFKGMKKISQPNRPLISIITSTYNAATLLPRTIESIRRQSYDNIEFIVVDGASKDGSVDVLRANEDVIDYWISEPDSGIYDAWNKGVLLARGEWIAFLGSDDAYYSDAIQQYVHFIQENVARRFEYVSTRVDLVNERQKYVRSIGRRWRWSQFQKKMSVAHVGSLHLRSLYERYGLYDTSYKIAADYEFLLRSGSALRAGFFDKSTATMQLGGASSNMIPALAEAMRAKHETGGRANLFCIFDNIIDMSKIMLRNVFKGRHKCR